MSRYERLREAERSISRYKKLIMMIENGIHEMFFIRDMLKGYSDEQVNSRLKQQAVIEKDRIDGWVREKAEILAAIDKIDCGAYQTVLKCLYIDGGNPVEVMGLTAKEIRTLRDEALLEYGRKMKDDE